MDYSILTIIGMIFLSAFFSGMEIAYVSYNRIHIEIEKKQSGFLARVLKKITKQPSQFSATLLLGNNIAVVIYSILMGELLMRFIPVAGFSGLLIQTAISTLILLLTAEFLPKVFFQIYANRLFKLFALPAYFFYILFSFISEFIMWLSELLLKYVFRSKDDSVQLTFTKLELGTYISEQMEIVEPTEEIDSEIQIFQNALDFSEIKCREAMIPRTEIVAVDIDADPKELAKIFTETGLSKLLVYNNNLDNIVGYIHSFELFKKPENIKKMLLPVVFVPGTMLAKDVMNILTKKRKSIAVIIDEYGGTSGMITVEDIIEELFGEIEDEYDNVALIEEELGEGHFRFSARLEVDYLNEEYDLDLKECEHYETLGGLIVNYTEEIPQKDEVVNIDGNIFTILEVSSTKIELVELKIPKDD